MEYSNSADTDSKNDSISTSSNSPHKKDGFINHTVKGIMQCGTIKHCGAFEPHSSLLKKSLHGNNNNNNDNKLKGIMCYPKPKPYTTFKPHPSLLKKNSNHHDQTGIQVPAYPINTGNNVFSGQKRTASLNQSLFGNLQLLNDYYALIFNNLINDIHKISPQDILAKWKKDLATKLEINQTALQMPIESNVQINNLNDQVALLNKDTESEVSLNEDEFLYPTMLKIQLDNNEEVTGLDHDTKAKAPSAILDEVDSFINSFTEQKEKLCNDEIDVSTILHLDEIDDHEKYVGLTENVYTFLKNLSNIKPEKEIDEKFLDDIVLKTYNFYDIFDTMMKKFLKIKKETFFNIMNKDQEAQFNNEKYQLKIQGKGHIEKYIILDYYNKILEEVLEPTREFIYGFYKQTTDLMKKDDTIANPEEYSNKAMKALFNQVNEYDYTEPKEIKQLTQLQEDLQNYWLKEIQGYLNKQFLDELKFINKLFGVFKKIYNKPDMEIEYFTPSTNKMLKKFGKFLQDNYFYTNRFSELLSSYQENTKQLKNKNKAKSDKSKNLCDQYKSAMINSARYLLDIIDAFVTLESENHKDLVELFDNGIYSYIVDKQNDTFSRNSK